MRAARRGLPPAVLFLLAGCQATPERQAEALRTEVLTALRGHRTTEARLTGGFRHAPCRIVDDPEVIIPRSRCASLPTPGSPAFQRAAQATQRLRAGLEGELRPLLLPVAAAVDLVWGHDDPTIVDRAIDQLEERRRSGPADADVLNDLAAGHLIRSALRQKPEDLLAALELTDDALQVAPGHAEARFNRALTLDRLHLADQARRAWHSFLDVETDPSWADEAQRRGDVRPGGRDLPPEFREQYAEAAIRRRDAEAVDVMVGRSPQVAREFATWILLPRWAEETVGAREVRTGDALWGARAIGRALKKRSGDETLADAVGAVDRLWSNGATRGRVRAVAAARLKLARTYEIWNEAGDLEEAHDLLLAAAPVMDSLAPAMALELRSLQGTLELHMGRIDSGDRRFRDLLEKVDPSRHPTLAARAYWGRAVASIRRGHLQSAHRSLEEARRLYDAGGETQNVGTMHHLSSEVLYVGGRYSESMSRSLRAIPLLAPAGTSRWLRTSFLQLGRTAEAVGYPRAAEVSYTEAVGVAGRLGVAVLQVETLLQRLRVRTILGDLEGARTDLEQAKDAFSRVVAAREYFHTRIKLAEVPLDLRRGGWSEDRIADAIGALRRDGREVLLPELYRELAGARLAQGDPMAARGALLAAVRQIEKSRRDLTQAEFDVGFMHTAERVFDGLIALDLSQGDAASALRHLEESRAAHGFSASSWTGTESRDHDEVLVEYAVLDSSLVIWTLGPGGLSTTQVPVDSATLGHAVRAWTGGPAHRGDTALARQVFDWLVHPVRDELAAATRLVIVPDRVLGAVPFASLFDGRTGRYLVEDFELALARSATARASRRSGTPPGRRATSALVVGGSGFDRSWFRDLPALPGARREVEAVSRLFDTADILTGTAATPSALLELMPRHSVLHFAGHALAAPASPALSRLVLAPDEVGESTLDGGMIRRLRLDGLELVVLSACSTAGGTDARNGGVLGLADSFLSAGAGEVIATLREVDDQATTSLMVRFHQFYREGRTAADALRAVQLEALDAWRNGRGAPPPEDWGAFVLISS